MANGKISRSWTFFGLNNEMNNEYLYNDYQPPQYENTRIDLQQRFNQMQNTNNDSSIQAAHHKNAIKELEHEYDEVYEEPQNYQQRPFRKQYYREFQSQSYGALPRRSLRHMPQGIAPLWNNIQDNFSTFKPDTSKLFHDGGNKINKVFQSVKTSILSVSQKFKRTTRRRYKLDDSEYDSPNKTPRLTKRMTPGKLYSPFNVSTPMTPHSIYTKQPKRLQKSTPRRLYGNDSKGGNAYGTPNKIFTSQLSNRKQKFISPRSRLQHHGDPNASSQPSWGNNSGSPKVPITDRLSYGPFKFK